MTRRRPAVLLVVLLCCLTLVTAGCSTEQTSTTTTGLGSQTTETVMASSTTTTTAAPTTTTEADELFTRENWAVLAEKDNYDDVQMTNVPVNYIGITQLHQLLLDSGWQEAQIHEAREFDRESLIAELDWLAENAGQDDLVFVYVAAHGVYLRDVLGWSSFFGREWEQIPSYHQFLLIDSCQAGEFTDAVASDPEPYISVAAVGADEFSWSGLEEEGLPIIGGVFTHYFTLAFQDPKADADEDGQVSIQEAALWAEAQQRTYMHEVVFAVPEFVESYHEIGVYPEQDTEFPHAVVRDTIGAPVFLESE